MDKWKECYDYYKRNPTNYYEDMLGVKFTKLQKINLRIYIYLIDYMDNLIMSEKELLYRMTLEPYKNTKHEIFRLRSEFLEVQINIIKRILDSYY